MNVLDCVLYALGCTGEAQQEYRLAFLHLPVVYLLVRHQLAGVKQQHLFLTGRHLIYPIRFSIVKYFEYRSSKAFEVVCLVLWCIQVFIVLAMNQVVHEVRLHRHDVQEHARHG